MKKAYITENSEQTKELGKLLGQEITAGKIICLYGDLGAGKTTFTQGFLAGLSARGPFTSPTFLIMKQYELKNQRYKIKTAYHLDAYRIKDKDVLNLGWEEIIDGKDNIVIVEWAERIKRIIPKNSLWIKFKWLGQEKRQIIMTNKF